MRITYYSHSCFLVEAGEYRLLFDPFLTGNPLAPVTSNDIRCHYILCSHAHDDHVGDTLQIAKANAATVIAPFELADYLAGQGAKTIDLMLGGGRDLPFGRVQLTPAFHSSSFERSGGNNLAMGVASGLLVTIDGEKIYHAGDTALFSDMHLIGRKGLDVALLPIGDHYTMGIDDAVLALDYLCPTLAIPMHYGTNHKIEVDPHLFAAKAAEAGHRVTVLRPGECTDLVQ